MKVILRSVQDEGVKGFFRHLPNLNLKF